MKSTSKFHNVRTTQPDGQRFDSNRHAELQLLERVGLIRNLRRQVAYELLPAVKLACRRQPTPAVRYFADFVYFDVESGREVIEDVKGAVTEAYRLKRHMMKALLGLDIIESKPR